ncbi:class III lanthionine synthetase LanKC [Streptomyces flavofungini]|uniref:Class III lanthionine synthetase LanKC n=1 Tax=Streptomyces flavofungini TaxID=68200 RepID=A0ABS0X7R0_9ACTN|nr:class III lanthionine synthetase LanKC [Streptomyces flavofungini]MBJ3809121.1 class III lanthionine synthetase LanKC [Streptomyces flavofungini]GHC68660.1 serine/threonine protein kinase [Streptomyces flavofungini]
MKLQDYDRFYRADPDFFEFPERLADASSDRLSAVLREPPRGWRRTEAGWWVRLRPPAARPPGQGWRIHVSVTLPHLERTAEVVREYCVHRGIGCDLVRSVTAARALADVRADRLTSADLMVLYPADETELAAALRDLTALLAPLPGPYVPGALRHGSGPLYVRHAAAENRRCPAGGHPSAPGDEHDLVPALERPDGTLVPEDRRPVFRLPDWVALPEVLRADLEALLAPPRSPFPYRSVRAVSLTTGDGTYRATDSATDRPVVLHEARPHAGLDVRGDDAVTRLTRERALLERLAHLDCVPGIVGHHIRAGHHFLAVEDPEGRSLAEAAAAAFPLTTEDRAQHEAADYTKWALDVADRVGDALDSLKRRGVRLGELHPEHIVLRPDGSVVLTRLRSATDLKDDRPPSVGEEGFTAPVGLRGGAAHTHLLDTLRLWLLLPVPHRDPATLRVLTETVDELYPVPPEFGATLLSRLRQGAGAKGTEAADDAGALAAERPDWPALRARLVAGLHAMATPERTDRLFPGTPFGPAGLGGTSFGHGAAGVLYALHQVGEPVPGEYADWLADAATRDPDPRPGLYDGLHGVALTLDLLGHRDRALGVLERSRPLDARVVRPDLAGGQAGIALNLLRFARLTGDTALHDGALHIADDLAALVVDGPPVPRAGTPPPYGLLHGPAGIALLFLHLYEQGGGARFLELADRALGFDIARCTTGPDGALTLFDGTHHLPYLHGGSGGLAFPLRALLRHRPAPGRSSALAAVRHTCRALYVRNSGLLRGRAGAIAVLTAMDGPGDREAVRTQVRRMAWYAHSYRGQLAFPGFRMLRLSADLATGAAGVLLALDSAFGGGGPVLPYLDPRPTFPRADGRR